MRNRYHKYRPGMFWKKHRIKICILAIILITPIIVGLVYNIPIWNSFPLSAGEVLTFYGVALGIFVSVVFYLNDQKKENLRRTRAIRPAVGVICIPMQNSFSVEVIIRNNNNIFQDLSFFDVNVHQGFINQKVRFQVSLKEDKTRGCNYVFSDLIADSIDSADNLPHYMCFFFSDQYGNTWDCEFDKEKDGNGMPLYVPSMIDTI